MSSTSALSEEEFEVLRRKAERAGLPVLAMNGMLPSDFHLCSDQLDTQGLTAYLHKAFSRAQALGVKTVVFGSGGARRYPLDMEYALAMDYLVAYLRLAGPLADNYGLSIAVEPLREQECNIINSVMEARQLAKMANQANVGVLADLFHMPPARRASWACAWGPCSTATSPRPPSAPIPRRATAARGCTTASSRPFATWATRAG